MRLRGIAAASFLVVSWAACSIKGPSGGGVGSTGAGDGTIVQNCQTACEFKYPGAIDVYEALKSCLVCGACHDACGATCGSSDQGCSADNGDCSSCIVSPCALSQNADTTFTGACAMEGQACSQSSDCVGLNNCVANCVATTGPSGSSSSAGGAGGSGGAGGAMTTASGF